MNVSDDIKLIIQELDDEFEKVKTLMNPNFHISLFYILRNVIICFISALIVLNLYKSSQNIFLLTIGVILISPFISRSIRSFGNHVHEGMHGNLYRQVYFFKGKSSFFKTRPRLFLNDLLTRRFLCPLMFYDFDLYIKEHKSHHGFLGDKNDLEKLTSVKYEIVFEKKWLSNFFLLMLSKVFSFDVWKRSFLGDLFSIQFNKSIKIILWWTLLVWTLNLLYDNLGITFLFIWMFNRATFYHFLKIFCEFVDHYNLPNDNIVSYTRTMPNDLISFFIHPDNDNYHTAHHIFPSIPMSNLKKAHKLCNTPHLLDHFSKNIS